MASWFRKLLIKIARANLEEFGSDPIDGYDYVYREHQKAEQEPQEKGRTTKE